MEESLVAATKPALNKFTALASSNLVRIPGVIIERIQRAVRFNQRTLCHMQVDHGSGDFRMTKQFFEGNDID